MYRLAAALGRKALAVDFVRDPPVKIVMFLPHELNGHSADRQRTPMSAASATVHEKKLFSLQAEGV